jgi:PP-loop superfamily ATP-utilizing enzyme
MIDRTDGERVGDLERFLSSRGFDDVSVSVAGHQRDIAVIAAPPDSVERLARLAPEIREIGFRYVTIDLDARAR